MNLGVSLSNPDFTRIGKGLARKGEDDEKYREGEGSKA